LIDNSREYHLTSNQHFSTELHDAISQIKFQKIKYALYNIPMKKETVMGNNHSINIYSLQPLISQTTTYNHLSHKQQLATTYLTDNNLQPLVSQRTTYSHLSHKQQLTTTYLTNNNLQPLVSQTTTYIHLSHKQQLTTTYLTNNNLQPLISQTK